MREAGEHSLVLVDTNVVLRHFLRDHSAHSPRAAEFSIRVARGDFVAYIPPTVVFEVVFTLERTYRMVRTSIRDIVLGLLSGENTEFEGWSWIADVFDIYVRRNLSFADSYHAILARVRQLDGIVSFDRGFDRIDGLTRIEP